MRRGGKLKEAHEMAEADFRAEDSEWSRSALFWVLRDMFNESLAAGDRKSCQSLFSQMGSVCSDMRDEEGFAKRALAWAQRELCPHYQLLAQANELSKNGKEKEAYELVEEVHKETPIEDELHEAFGWIIYHYLQKDYKSTGSVPARTALNVYMNLHNPRPSRLHSRMLNLASQISEEYHDFRLLPFIRLWNVANFREDDLNETQTADGVIRPLYIRLFSRCIELGFSLEECIAVFCQDPDITEDKLLAAYGQQCYVKIFQYSKDKNLNGALQTVQQYLRDISGKITAGEYHSKILRSYLFMGRDQMLPSARETLEAFGFDCFRAEDWVRGKADNGKEYPSLVEKFITKYKDSLKQSADHCPSRDIKTLLMEAVSRYPDNDQIARYLAKAYIDWGEREKAVEMYGQLLRANSKFYLWRELSQIVDDHDLKISALCMALLSEKQEEFLGEVHLLLAGLMVEDKAFPEASRELDVYAQTYKQKGWPVKPDYDKLRKEIPAGTVSAENNKRFYQEHKDKAEKFVYSPLPWTSMVVADIIQSRDNPGKPMARLVGADGSVVLAGERQIGSKIRNNLAGRCFDVKLVDKGDRKQAVLVRESEKTVTELFESCIGYVEYYNEDKLLAHVYDQQSNQYLVHLAPGLKAEKFIRFCPLPETGRDSHFIPHGIFISESDYETSTEAFPAHVGIVDNVNEQKQLFHCVFGTNSDSVIRFASTSIRSVVGDIVVARYVLTKGKDERLRKSVFDIKVDNSRHTPLLREAEGEIRLNVNARGEQYGFVGDYYIPGRLLDNVGDGDHVKAQVLYDGEKWHAYSLSKDSEESE